MKAVLGLIVGLAISLGLAAFAGEDPMMILKLLFTSSFGSQYDLGLTLFYTTALIFTGLAVAIPFHAGLFNIGAEGQLTIGAVVAVACGIQMTAWPFPLGFVGALLMGAMAGGLWGFIPGWLKARMNSHEVINTMMMNFIAAALSSWMILGVLKNPLSQNPESKQVGPGFQWGRFDFVAKMFPDSPANIFLLFAILAAIIVYLLLRFHVVGFELRATGEGEKAASLAGIPTKNVKIFALTVGGALAACAGMNEVLGASGKFTIGFSPDFGFVGIAVALLARNHPIGILFSAFLFGALQKGASDLDLETQFITRDFARVMQAIIIFSVAGFQYLDFEKLKGRLWK